MRASRPPSHPSESRGWQATQAGDLSPPLHSHRTQPPLREVLKGLDARELEGETVFDQLFGSTGVPAPGRR